MVQRTTSKCSSTNLLKSINVQQKYNFYKIILKKEGVLI